MYGINRNEMAAHDSKLKWERKSQAYITAEPKRSLVCYYRDTLAIYCTEVAYIKKNYSLLSAPVWWSEQI